MCSGERIAGGCPAQRTERTRGGLHDKRLLCNRRSVSPTRSTDAIEHKHGGSIGIYPAPRTRKVTPRDTSASSSRRACTCGHTTCAARYQPPAPKAVDAKSASLGRQTTREIRRHFRAHDSAIDGLKVVDSRASTCRENQIKRRAAKAAVASP